MEWLQLHWLEVTAVFTSIMTVASIVARWTPTESDDLWVQKILDVVHALGLTKK